MRLLLHILKTNNWKISAGTVIVLAVLGYVGNLQLTIARQGRQIGELRADLSRAVPAISREDAEALLRGVASVKRDLEGAREEIRKLEGRPGFVREIVRTGPPGQPGRPGLPGRAGTPGTPLILPERAERERERATERILAFFDEGSLIGCQGPGLPPLTVELLRDPTGRLLSTAPCVWRINDEVFRDQILPPRQRLFSFEPYISMGWISGGAELGVGADLLHAGPWSVGAALWVARWAPPASAFACLCHASLGASYAVLGNVRVLGGYAFALRPDLASGPFLGISLRF